MLRYFFITIFFCFSASVIAEEEFDKGKLSELTLYIPGSEGGGYHHTAMALKHIFEHELDVTLNLKHVPGAGGVLALSQFTSIEESKNNAILLGGQAPESVQRHRPVTLGLALDHDRCADHCLFTDF